MISETKSQRDYEWLDQFLKWILLYSLLWGPFTIENVNRIHLKRIYFSQLHPKYSSQALWSIYHVTPQRGNVFTGFIPAHFQRGFGILFISSHNFLLLDLLPFVLPIQAPPPFFWADKALDVNRGFFLYMNLLQPTSKIHSQFLDWLFKLFLYCY